MSFLETVDRACTFLGRHRRVSLRALRREFDLDPETLAELSDELVQVQHVAVLEGDVLVWAGQTPPAAPPVDIPSPQRDPRAYTPKHLADKILQSKSALEGERKQVTVLFADVKGSMELAEQLDAEEWHKILDRFFAILTDGVHRFEGTVNQYTGDGIMALFGAPIAHEDHAQRACYAALQLQEELRCYADELRLGRGLNFSVRMGLNSGEVVVGKIGDDLRMDYTAQGHTVGLAARMEQLAAPGDILLTEHTAKLISGLFALRDLGQSRLKGVTEPLRVYQLEGAGRFSRRFEVVRTRGFSRFVGRANEVQSLEAGLARAAEGNGQIIGVVGEAGTGKSRLCHEFAQQCRARGIRVHEGCGVAHGRMIPFLPVLQLLRGYFGITEQDSDHDARDKIAGELPLDETFKDALPLLCEFLGVPDPQRPAPRMDPEARQRQLFEVLRRLTHARGQREPAVILLEDLQWIDGGSEAFLENMVDALPATRTLLLVTFRPEYHADWTQKSYYQQLPLLPLGASAIAEMLTDVLGNDRSLAGVAARIRERTRGNPFFIEEVVQSLVESGTLAGVKSAYQLIKPIDEVTIPATVQAVLAARIDRLMQREKLVLQTAAVIGKEFAESVLARVGDLPAAEVSAALRALLAAEFVYAASLYPEAVYAFKHPLTQEVAYGSQLSERRARVHAAVARALTEVYAARLDEQAALLAHHWEGAGDVVEAARWHERAARWAGVSNPAESLRHWRRVRALLETVSASAESTALSLRARIQILDFGWRLGLSDEEATALFAEGKALATHSGDMRSLAMLIGSYARVRSEAGNAEEAIAHMLEAARVAEQTDNARLKLTLRARLAYSLLTASRYRDALAVAEAAIEWAQADPQLDAERRGFGPSVWLVSFRGFALSWVGRLAEAARELDRGAALARRHGELETLCFNHVWQVELAQFTGDASAAMEHARALVEIAEKTGSEQLRVLEYYEIGAAHCLREEWQAAVEALCRALVLARERRTFLDAEAALLLRLAEAYVGSGEVIAARAAVDEALQVGRQRHNKATEGLAMLDYARIWLRSEGAKAREQIEHGLARALTLIEEAGATSYTPFIHLERAELARLSGDAAARQRELREAHRLFLEIGAPIRAAEVARYLES